MGNGSRHLVVERGDGGCLVSMCKGDGSHPIRRRVPPLLRPISVWGLGGFKPLPLSLPPMVVLGHRTLAVGGLGSGVSAGSTLPLPPLLTLKGRGGDPHPQTVLSNFSTTLSTLSPATGPAPGLQDVGLGWPLPPFLETSLLAEGWRGVEGMLSLGTTRLCDRGLAAPGHPTSSGSCNPGAQRLRASRSS